MGESRGWRHGLGCGAADDRAAGVCSRSTRAAPCPESTIIHLILIKRLLNDRCALNNCSCRVTRGYYSTGRNNKQLTSTRICTRQPHGLPAQPDLCSVRIQYTPQVLKQGSQAGEICKPSTRQMHMHLIHANQVTFLPIADGVRRLEMRPIAGCHSEVYRVRLVGEIGSCRLTSGDLADRPNKLQVEDWEQSALEQTVTCRSRKSRRGSSAGWVIYRA